MDNQKIAFIGAGNMGRCLIAGLIANGYSREAIHVVDPNEDTREHISQDFQINTHESPKQALKAAKIVVLAVKPQITKAAISGIKSLLDKPHPLILSIVAGIQSKTILGWLDADFPLVRTMPNTPAMIGSGATALFAAEGVTKEQRSMAESIMRSVGIIQWLDDETLMDAVTAISGSGPAYYFRVIEAMEKAAIKLGLSKEQARILTIQTAFGATKMALESPLSPTDLRKQVTSPGGTTEQALKVLQKGGIDGLFEEALQAASDRSEELAKELDC